MTTPSDHLDPKEATEARLCAYLEGELPAIERAEIEQHLAANPQHRKLLTDLAQTRDWMRVLPRETAPSELAESFQGQVERSMLLEDPDGKSMTIIRWPQIAMMAAIVTLTLGLGVTLVIILKGPAARDNVAIGPMGSQTPARSSIPTSQPSSIESMDHAVAAAPIAKAQPAIPAPVITTAAPTPPAAAAITASPLTADAPHKELGVDDIRAQLLAAGYRPTSDVKSVCFVVRTDAVASSAEQLQGFFARHQLVLEQPASLTNKTFALADQQPYNGINGQRRLQNSAKNSSQLDTTQAAQDNANDATANAPNQNVKLAQQQVPAGGPNNLVNSGTAANTTQPIVVGTDARENGPVAKALGSTAGGLGGGASSVLPGAPLSPVAPAGNSDQQLYVAHNVTPLQVELLDASLAADNPNASVRRLTLSQGPITTAGLITKGQTLIITVPQLVGPGMDKANVVKVNDDGTIILPMLDALPAAGATMDELQQRIVTRYKDANLIPNATVNIATPPSTQPGLFSGALSTTMPAGLLPATNPVAATTQPASGIDVVVVLQKADAADRAK